MGEHDVDQAQDEEQIRAFTTALLNDVRALERMLEGGMIESGVRRIGAEQEMFLVDGAFEPNPIAVEMLERIDDPAFTTELARFNLEANLPPYDFSGDCLGEMEKELRRLLEKALAAAESMDASVILSGILPTLRLEHLGLDNMTPMPRYFALNRAVVGMRGEEFKTHIKGIDELFATHDNVMMESCNTSFQVHYQVGADEFPRMYNLAQVITAPLLAAAVNSPMMLGKRLWHETRVALFQHSVDSRTQVELKRGVPGRVSFGDRWLEDSVLDLFRSDISRFRVVLAKEVDDNSVELLEGGQIPKLGALCLHNGTVYRWNRPCYGAHGGVAHLRIENRVLPAGPTVLDEMANAAFFFGLMAALPEEYGDVTEKFNFDEVKANFVAAARLGLHAQFTWTGDRSAPADHLILEHLLPLARQGLETAGVNSEHVDRYLGVLEQRVSSGRTGSQWALDSLAAMGDQGTRDERIRALTGATLERQKTSEPVHTWEPAAFTEGTDWRHSYETVGQFMTTELFTLRPQDVVDLAASLMDWQKIRYIPVETEEGAIVGIVSHRTLLRLLAEGGASKSEDPVAISEIMKRDIVTAAPDMPTLEAIALMRENKVGCLPIVDKGRLVGMISEQELIELAATLLEDSLREFRRE